MKAQIVKLTHQRGAPPRPQFASAPVVDAHLRYLERDGVHRHGEKGHVLPSVTWRTAAPSSTGAATTATSSGSSSPPRDQAPHIRTDPSPSSKCTSAVEALRRAGIVEPIDADRWRVPNNLPERGLAHDLARDGVDARAKCALFDRA